MINTVTTVTITFVVSSLLTYIVNVLKSYKKRDEKLENNIDSQKQAILCLLRSNITSTCLKYLELGYVPQQEYENVNMMKDAYVGMGGNSYVIELVKEFNELPKK